MKRLLSIATALFIAALFVLPGAAIAHLDGSEPEWTGEAGIMPAMDTLEGIEPIEPLAEGETVGIVPYNEELPGDDGVAFIGEPTDELPGGGALELDEIDDFERNPLARSADMESVGSANVSWVLLIGLGAAGLVVLLLVAFVLVKFIKKKA